jgi:hypothetical protein
LQSGLAVTLFVSGVAAGPTALADSDYFQPGNLLLSRVVYDNNPNNVQAGVTQLPPNCVGSACVVATNNGTYPYVWNNNLVDGRAQGTAIWSPESPQAMPSLLIRPLNERRE